MTTTSQAIIQWYGKQPQEHRPHMGASLIGDQCQRKVWLTWRWALKPEFEGRILRLFEYGKKAEDRIFEEMRAVGIKVWDTDPATGSQWRVSDAMGHFGGSLDAVAKGLPESPNAPCVVEVKTHNDKSFKELTEKGVRESKPIHWAQMQIYCHLMELPRALYIAENKNTSELYTELVEADPAAAEMLLDRARTLIGMPVPPARLSEDPANWICKMCNFWQHCHGGVAAEANCRTCVHASPVENAQWRCEFHGNAVLSEQAQRDGCEVHLLIPPLIPYAEPIDGADGWMAYRHRETGAQFVNAAEGVNDYGPVFSSKELHRCPSDVLEGVAKLKNEFGGKVVSGGLTTDFKEWLDEASTNPDDIQAKAPTQAERKTRSRNKAFAETLKQMESK